VTQKQLVCNKYDCIHFNKDITRKFFDDLRNNNKRNAGEGTGRGRARSGRAELRASKSR
jgi:hypothetical protein